MGNGAFVRLNKGFVSGTRTMAAGVGSEDPKTMQPVNEGKWCINKGNCFFCSKNVCPLLEEEVQVVRWSLLSRSAKRIIAIGEKERK